MLIEVALTKEIINESLPVHYRHAPKALRFLPFTIPAVFLLIASVNAWVEFSNGNTTGALATLGMYGIIVFGFGYYVHYRRVHAGKQMMKILGDRVNYEIDVDEERLVTRLIDATYTQQWTVYPKAVIGKDVVLLYQQNRTFAIFHHSFFANDDFDRFKQLVRRRVHEVKED